MTADEAGRRCSDIIRLHILAGMAGQWAAIRLSDGGSDGIPYPSKKDAVRHQLHETLCAYVRIPRDDMPPAEAARFLGLNRLLYDKGLRLADPDGPDLEVIVPDRAEEFDALVAQILREGIR